MDERDFRAALSSFATGVTIVTAADSEGTRAGMTASSFNSVSMSPPLVLWSVTKTAASADTFRAAVHYAIHVLGSDQQQLAMKFATAGIDKFAGVDVIDDRNGVPILGECVVRFDCKQWAVYEGGDHWIIVGEVIGLHRVNTESLIFCEGAFGTVNPIRELTNDRDVDRCSGDSPVDQLLLYNLSRAYHQMSRQFHASVRDSGLSISQWRILASLYGRVTRDLQDLQDRTFLERDSLQDALTALERDGLCTMGPDGLTILGTEKGHERVRHLFELGHQQELQAIDDETLSSLIGHLGEIVKNTSDLK